MTFTRHSLTAILAATVLLFGIVLGTTRSTVVAQDGSAPSASPDASPAAEAAFTYVIDAEQSTASYEVMEELAEVGENQVIGTTNAMQGSILLDDQMNPIAGSRIDVDLRFLASDSTRRDNYLYENTLETGEFPLATFIVTGTQDLTGPLVDGEEATFKLVGDLTIHGVTNEATWDVTAALNGDTLTGSATTSFALAQYDMEQPVVGPVVSIEETIDLSMDIVAIMTA